MNAKFMCSSQFTAEGLVDKHKRTQNMCSARFMPSCQDRVEDSLEKMVSEQGRNTGTLPHTLSQAQATLSPCIHRSALLLSGT